MTRGSDLCFKVNRRDLVKAGAATASLAALGGLSITPARAQDSFNITLVLGVQGDEFYISMACGAQVAAEERGVSLDVQGPEKFDATLQTPLLNAVVQAGPDAIL